MRLGEIDLEPKKVLEKIKEEEEARREEPPWESEAHDPSSLQPLSQVFWIPSPAVPATGLGHRWANCTGPQLSLCKMGTASQDL